MNAQDKNDEKQQRPDGGYWAESRNDPGTTDGKVSNGQGGTSSSTGTTAGSPTDDDSNLTGTDSQPNDESEQEHAMHMSGQRYDAADKDASAGSSASTMKEDEALFDEGQATTPGTSAQTGGAKAAGSSSSGTGTGTGTGQHGAGSGGSGTGEAGALSHETGAPGLSGGTSASGTSDDAEGDVTLGSGGTGAGLPDGTKGN